eukprot:Seg609.6 transcript_id=Seg609.6/GoldUCD/mRNA.D3Y31 product="Solute carrier family 35 member G1" protein_id=Seg609.6/GoldUCD/D3Y31
MEFKAKDLIKEDFQKGMTIPKPCRIACLQEFSGNSKLFGMFLMAMAGLFLTFSNLFVQLAIDANKQRIPTLEIVFARSFAQLILLSPWLLYYRVKITTERKNLSSLIIMGICGFLSVTFIYLGIDKVPLGDATVIAFTSPVFTTFFAYALLSESCSFVDGVCGLISFTGVIIAARPNFIFGESHGHTSVMFNKGNPKYKAETLYMMGVGYILLGAIFVSMYYVLTRKIGQQQHFAVNIFYPSLLGTIFVPILMLPHSNFMFPACWKSRLFILLVGVFGLVGLILLAWSLKLEDAGPLILIRNLDIVYAFVLQYCFMGTAPSWWSIGGGLIVMSSTSIVVGKRWFGWKKERNQRTDELVEEEEMTLLDNSESNEQLGGDPN